jgi:hypothetical protein
MIFGFGSNLLKDLSKIIKKDQIEGVKLYNLEKEFLNTFELYLKKENILFSDLDFINKYLVFNGNNIRIYYDNKLKDKKYYVIINTWSDLYKLTEFIKENLKHKFSFPTLTVIESQIIRLLNNLSSIYEELLEKIPNITTGNTWIESYNKIEVKYCIKEKSIKIIDAEKQFNIDKIKININSEGGITSILLNRSHPNADENNWFCLGSLKNKKLSVDTFLEIIERISHVNNNDCYWKI